jgi:hypothetical protein
MSAATVGVVASGMTAANARLTSLTQFFVTHIVFSSRKRAKARAEWLLHA